MIASKNTDTATYTRVFNSGNSQAVRIPASFRLDTDKVKISQLPDGKLLLEPILKSSTSSRGQALLSVLSGFDNDFIKALEDSENESLPMQERDIL